MLVSFPRGGQDNDDNDDDGFCRVVCSQKCVAAFLSIKVPSDYLTFEISCGSD